VKCFFSPSTALLLLLTIYTHSVQSEVVTGQRVLDDAFELVGQPDAIANGFTGDGAAVAVVEFSSVDFIGALDHNGELLFGDCQEPQWVTDSKAIHGNNWWLEKGHLGYAPEQGPGAACRVAWVQCFTYGYQGFSKCTWPPAASPYHQREVAAIVARTAPDAKILLLHQGNNVFSTEVPTTNPQTLRGTLLWLQQFGYQNFTDFDPSLSVAEKDEWLVHLQTEFGTQSPIERWGVKAVNLSWDGLKSGPFGGYNNNVKYFSSTCLTNPGTEPFNPDKYLDDMRVFGFCGTSPDPVCEAKQRAFGADFDMTQSFSDLRNAGVLPITAAANQSNYKNGHSWPACTEGALVVSAVFDGHESHPGTSTDINGATHPTMTTLLAPSPHVGVWHSEYPQSIVGVSFALPIVSASLAILGGSNLMPEATVDQLELLLTSTGEPVTESRECNLPMGTPFCPDSPPYGSPIPGFSIPRLNLAAAITAADQAFPVPIAIDAGAGNIINANILTTSTPIPVTIESTALIFGDPQNFDVANIDLETLRFGTSGASPASIEEAIFVNVDEDWDIDLIIGFPAADTGIVCDDTEAALYGATTEGQFFTGSNTMTISNCATSTCHP